MGKSIRNLSTVTRVGLDLAKRVFQVHAVDAKSEIVVARKLTREADGWNPRRTIIADPCLLRLSIFLNATRQSNARSYRRWLFWRRPVERR